MSNHKLIINEKISFIHSGKLKAKHFLYNTKEEYRVGYYLWEKGNCEKEFVLDVSWDQSAGDFTLDTKSFELKSNRGALSSGALSFEVINTSTCEPSGLFKSVIDNVDYFLVYLPAYEKYNGKYTNLIDNLLVLNTKKLHSWIKDKEELYAKNNNFIHSNALCYKVPVSYIEDSSSFKDCIVDKIHIPESELLNIPIPKELYSLFENE